MSFYREYEGTPFPAVDAWGNRYNLTPIYRLMTLADGWIRAERPDLLVRLRTDLWRWAERDAKGRYRLTDREPNLVLTSDHPDAV